MNIPTILAIDPGDKQSAVVVYGSNQHISFREILDNNDMLDGICEWAEECGTVAIEMIASYGMPVGREVFETCVWIGRFIQKLQPTPVRLIYRKDVKMHLCGSVRAKDANIRQALADMFGGKACKGTKKNPGPLFGFHDDLWAALGVAVTAAASPHTNGEQLQAVIKARKAAVQ